MEEIINVEEINEIFDEVIEEPLDNFIEEPIKVFFKLNDNNEIIEVGSSIFIRDTNNWIVIDQGFGDKYAHAQSQYFDKSLINDDGKYNYSFINGEIRFN